MNIKMRRRIHACHSRRKKPSHTVSNKKCFTVLASVQTKVLGCIGCKPCSDANCWGTGFRTSRQISDQGQHVMHLGGTEGVVGLVQRALPGTEASRSEDSGTHDIVDYAFSWQKFIYYTG
jgi:hypothetical protein